MSIPSKYTEEDSKRIFWVIQIIFGFILARSFFVYSDAFIPPYHKDIYTLTLALFTVYACVMWSWIDFSFTTIVSPYHFRKNLIEKFRFLTDLLIVLLYSYLLSYISRISDFPNENFYEFFYAFALIFFGYLLSGLLRMLEYGRRASKIGLIIFFILVFTLNAYLYHKSYKPVNCPEYNRTFFVYTFGLYVFYRIIRWELSSRKFNIAVDVDGVLANQIEGILPIIEKDHGVKLTYDDITDWKLPINDTDIAVLIVDEQNHKNYVINMPVHQGAETALNTLIKKHYISIATARAKSTDTWTKNWLSMNKIPFDNYYNLKEGEKHNADIEFDILIDDYPGNIIKFLERADGKAILFTQPWNTDHSGLELFINEGRLAVVTSWDEIPATIANQLSKTKE